MAKREICIVFTEYDTLGFAGNAPDGSDGGKRFDVHLRGISDERMEEIKQMTPEQQRTELSSAEFFGLRGFQGVVQMLASTGAIQSTEPRPKTKIGG